MLNEFKDQIKELITKGDTLAALRIFLKFLEEQESTSHVQHLQKKLLLLESDLTRLDREFNLGLVTSEERNVRITKGNKLLFSLIEESSLLSNVHFETNLKTVFSFSIICIVITLISLVYGEYFYVPREELGVPQALQSIYGIIFLVSSGISIYFTYINYGKSIKLFQAIIAFMLLYGAFYFGPYISSVYIQQGSKQDSANSRYEAGQWEKAMFIYVREKHKLNQTSKLNIIAMKKTLNMAGYYLDEINDAPTMKVIDGLMKLQRDFGVKQDGYIGRETKNLLYAIIYSDILNVDVRSVSMEELSRKIMKYQRKNQLFDDGVIGNQTLECLQKNAASQAPYQQ